MLHIVIWQKLAFDKDTCPMFLQHPLADCSGHCEQQSIIAL